MDEFHFKLILGCVCVTIGISIVVYYYVEHLKEFEEWCVEEFNGLVEGNTCQYYDIFVDGERVPFTKEGDK